MWIMAAPKKYIHNDFKNNFRWFERVNVKRRRVNYIEKRVDYVENIQTNRDRERCRKIIREMIRKNCDIMSWIETRFLIDLYGIIWLM